MPAVFAHENAAFENFSLIAQVFWGFSLEHVDRTSKKKFGNKPGTKELLEKIFATFVEFLQHIQHFLHKNLFWRRDYSIVSFHVLCLLGVKKK